MDSLTNQREAAPDKRRLDDGVGRVPRTTADIGVSPLTTSEPPKRLWIRKFKVRVLARQQKPQVLAVKILARGQSGECPGTSWSTVDISPIPFGGPGP